MNLVYIQNEYPVLSQTFVSNEIAELRRRGHRVRVVASRRGATFEGSADDQPDLVLREASLWAILGAHGHMVITCPAGYWKYSRWLVRRGRYFLPWAAHVPLIWRYLPAATQTHIHTHFATRAAGIAEGLRQVLGATRSVTLHAADIFKNTRLALQVENARLCTVTEHNQRYLSERDLTNVRLVRCGLDVESFPIRDPQQVERDLIVSVGRLVEKKGHDRLIRWLATQAGSPYRLRIIGEGEQRPTLSRLIDELGLADRVQLVGAMPSSSVIAEVARASVFALACRIDSDGDADGLPVVILEAALVGTPIVSTSVTGITEFLSRSTGYLARHDDEQDLHRALQEALTDPQRERRAANARDLVMTSFTLQAQADALLDLISGPAGSHTSIE
ncbi:glycosyltransferase [Microbacterium testaceum]|uniref:glycosyltransferase n=1 Tax=Microbacterium testaceum TaxID=2033 RepID=UPI00187BF552|nr:glycosyltransferase [Microbacterium testaceum]